MKKAIVIVGAAIAIFAACAVLWSRGGEVPAEPEQGPVIAEFSEEEISRNTIPVKAEPLPEPVPDDTQTSLSENAVPIKRAKSVKITTPTEAPQPTPEPPETPVPAELPVPIETPTPQPVTITPDVTEPAHSNYGGYVPGFGWIESQGAGQGIYATQIYENGNKVGMMG